jgi:cob(I)alamin adenosyltransferase
VEVGVWDVGYNLAMRQGLVYVFTGEGKGKTSAAIGTAVRAIGAGMQVVWIGFYKEASWRLSEVEPLRKLGIEVWLMGKGFLIAEARGKRQEVRFKIAEIAGGQKVVDVASEAEHKGAAEEALAKARELMGNADLLVLDEVNNALQDKLINLIDLIDLILLRKQTHLVLTGRGANPEIVKLADLVTDMRKVKHPYDNGKLAVRGLDF